METRIKTDLTNEPVTESQVKQFIKFAYDSDADEVTLINNLISAVRTNIENRTGLALGLKTYEFIFDKFDCIELYHDPITQNPQATGFELPVAPVDEIVSVKVDGETVTYTEKGKDFRTIIYDLGIREELIVEAKVGFGGTNTESVPEDIKEAIRKQIGRWYWYRDDYIEGKFIDEVQNIVKKYGHVF